MRSCGQKALHLIARVLHYVSLLVTGTRQGDKRLRAAAAALQTRVLHLDEGLLVIDKPAGLAVQGGPGVLETPKRNARACILISP